MKKKLFILCACAMLGLAACSGDSTDDKSGGLSIFSDATEKALPLFTAAGGSGGSGNMMSVIASPDPIRATWFWGSPIFEFYSMFADDNPGAYFNLYDELDWADGRFSDAISSGTDIAAVEVAAPWEVGFNAGDAGLRTYDKRHEYSDSGYFSRTYGRKEGTLYCMLNWTAIDRWSAGGEKSKSIVQAVYDESTGDLKLGMFMANYVDESFPYWEIVRAYAEGNTGTSLFTLKIIRDGYGYDHNVIGRGKARGAGNYFLLKLRNNGMEAPTTFYTFPADASLAVLNAMSDAGSGTPQGDTEGYAAGLPGNFTSSDIPTQLEVEGLTAP